VSALTFRLRERPPERLDLSPLVPQRLSGLSPSQIAQIPIGTTRRPLVVGEVFELSGHDSDDIRFVGGSDRLDGVATNLSRGRILVEGDVGQRLAFGMRGGDVRIAGSAGPFAASGALGGTITIDGSAGDCAGGAVYGAMYGLSGATLVIKGTAGARLGDRMRRGLIVAAEAGDEAACRMIAGTIVTRRVGDHPGFGMRRGTLLVGGHGRLLPSFVPTGRHRFVMLRLLRRELARLGQGDFVPDAVDRHAGDVATLGKGEILVALS
jgi:formylmethanofuran dehydrogenase subunit C